MTKRGAARAAALASIALAAGLGACSLLVPLDAQQCSSDDDCRGRGEAFADSVCTNHVCTYPEVPDTSTDAGPDVEVDANRGPWDCLSDPSQVPDPTQQVALSIVAFDALKPITNGGANKDGGSDLELPTAYTSAPGVVVTACNVLDPFCGSPLTDSVTTDDAGIARFSLAGNVVGVYQLRHPDYLPSELFPGAFLAHAKAEVFPTAMLHTKDVSLLAVAIGVPLETDQDGGVGHAFFQIYDCFDRQEPGVRFKMDIDGGPETVQWYTKNQLPSTTATETDELGAGGAVNVPIGALAVHAILVSTGKELGVVNAVIRPGATTFAWVRVRTH